MALVDTLKKNQIFNALTIEQQEIYTALAEEFEDTIELSIYLTPRELSKKLQLGNPEQWQNFLNMEPVKIFIKSTLNQNLQVAQRKSIQSLVKEAELGNVQAAKQVNEISGLLSKADDNKVIVLHQVSRPKLIPRKVEETQ